ncbi:hypothetical protein QR680_010954 [Steinernema hermaphroditum]|uniref:Uncharacterized protein n=1 Tax=Steinernema hermaphroditum TaxID=289476 RepID=A0AA39IS18_9BILA|nr:hypothetical protein QR680_010954 [Steinernema hermaphroditum]
MTWILLQFVFESATNHKISTEMSSSAPRTRRSARRTATLGDEPKPFEMITPKPEPIDEDDAAPPPVPERRIRRIRIKNFPVEDELPAPRSAFSMAEGSDASSSSPVVEPPTKKRRTRRIVIKPVVKPEPDDDSGDGKRRRKRKVLDWTPDGPTVGEEVPSHDEDDGEDDDPDFDEDSSNDESDDKEEIVHTLNRIPKQERDTSFPPVAPSHERPTRTQPRRAVNVPPPRAVFMRKQQIDFGGMPKAEPEFDPASDPESYEEDNDVFEEDGLIHLKFDKESRTVDNYGCYLDYDKIPVKKSAPKFNTQKLAMKTWMSKYVMIPGQTVLAKLM